MTEFRVFARREMEFRRAASAGAMAAAEILAVALRNQGEAPKTAFRLDGTATVTLEGAGAVAREFGTCVIPARPVLGPALRENRTRMTEAIARAISGARL
jgi:hypothetical protein